MHRLVSHSVLVLLLATAVQSSIAFAQTDDPASEPYFESYIRPILVTRCYECHAGKDAESGLRVDSREGIRSGGDRGPAVVPGKPEDSLLLEAISHSDPDLKMPPRGKRVSDETVVRFREWIRKGAVDPRTKPDHSGSTERVSADDFWAYEAITRPTVPDTGQDWAHSELDRFVFRKLEQHELHPSPDARPEVLLRRAYFDLIGLPPSPKEKAQFEDSLAQHGISHALADLVDELLARPQFGERWGRHWLDVARYAESSGKEANITFPYAWRFRDYVIDAVNDDLPFDRFITEQLAGDLLPARDDIERTRLLIATGFLAIGPKNLDAMDERQFAADVVDEQINAVTRVFMATSVACARCHDHKLDPYSMHDYYGLAGIFASSKTYFGTAVSPANRVGGDPLVLPRVPSTPILHRSISARRVETLKAERAALQRERFEKGKAFTLRDALRVLWRTGAIDGQLEKVDSAGKALPLAMGMRDAREIVNAPFLHRGEVNRPGDAVPRGFPEAIRMEHPPQIPADQSGRLELAKWLTSPEHPLTARVAVNRIWSHLFGRGLVATVDDFGATGRPPSHPELLDYLAYTFTADGWSLKNMIRRIMLSRAWRQSSTMNDESFRVDPENQLLWRMSKRRLEAEAMRDAMLAASGELELGRPTGSLVGRIIGDKPVSLVGLDKRLPPDLDGAVHRSVYLPVIRDRLPDVFEVFDFAEPGLVTGQRESTNVPTQALYLMNSEFVSLRASAMAARIRNSSQSTKDFVRQSFQICFAREPTTAECDRSLSYLAGAGKSDRRLRETNFCQALISTVEFRFLD